MQMQLPHLLQIAALGENLNSSAVLKNDDLYRKMLSFTTLLLPLPYIAYIYIRWEQMNFNWRCLFIVEIIVN